LPAAKAPTLVRETPIPTEKIVIDAVVVNPKLDASLFAKPQVSAALSHNN
jgi:hypothetical protein